MGGDVLLDGSQPDPSQADPSANPTGGQPAAEPADPNANVPFHKHPRFQELISQNRDFRTQTATQAQQIAQLQQSLQQMQQNAPRQGTPPSEEYTKAADALLKIMEVNPRLKALLGLSDAAPQLIKGYQGVQDLTQAQSTALLRSGRQEISSLAGKAGLAVDDDSIDLMEEMVAGVIRRTPGAEEKFRQGDLSPVGDAFKKISEGFIANLRRPAAASVAQTKDKVRGLPPAPRGGLPGGSAPAKLEPGKERAYEQGLHQKAMDMLANLTG